MRRIRYSLVAAAIVGGSITAGVAPAAAATVDVRPGQSIQAAVDAASPGDRIVVHPGTYHEAVQITTDDITLQGSGASASGTVLAPPSNSNSLCTNITESVNGICVVGHLDPNTGHFQREIRNIHISGFFVRDFPGSGVIAFGTHDMRIDHVSAARNRDYGIARFVSTLGSISDSVAHDSGEAGIYVGDSPWAHVTLTGNRVFGNGFGFFLRDSSFGDVYGNDAHDNCIGILVLNTGGNHVARWHLHDNQSHDNTRFCPPGEEGGPPTGGTGVALLGSRLSTVDHNTVWNNHVNQPSPFAAGIIVVSGGPNAVAADNTVAHNVAYKNKPADLRYDRSGTNNTFTANKCDTSEPAGLCS